jgi:hypothetical protein
VPARVKFSYERGEDGQERPYLWLDLRTENGPLRKVRGLIDTAADVTVMGADYAETLGLMSDDLEKVSAEGPTGTVSARRSLVVVRASLPGEPELVAPLHPLFIPGGTAALWGRDFMAVYAASFDERGRQFSLFPQQLEPVGQIDER